MVEEQRLDADLEHIHKRIEALDVRQFVSDHDLKLLFGKASESGHGQKDNGTKPSDHRRSLQPLALAVRNGAIQTELILQRVADLEHSLAHDTRLSAAFALEQQESAGGTKTEERHAEKPCLNQPRKRVERRRDS